MPKFLVISYDTDEQQSFYDFVEAADSDTAEQIVADVRDYALVVTCLESAELTRVAGQLKRSTNAHKTRRALSAAIEPSKDFCEHCDRSIDDCECIAPELTLEDAESWWNPRTAYERTMQFIGQTSAFFHSPWIHLTSEQKTEIRAGLSAMAAKKKMENASRKTVDKNNGLG